MSKLLSERTVTFHAILSDDYVTFGSNRAFNILILKDKNLDDPLDVDLGVQGTRFVEGGHGNDHIRAGSQLEAVMYGGPGDDEIVGGLEGDLLVGDQGKDTLDAGPGDDYLVIDEFDRFNGGAGMDRAIYIGSADFDINISDHEVEIFNSGSGDDFILTDLSSEAAIDGGPGSDRIYGSWGHDWLMGGKGKDFLEGGFGNDTYIFRRGDGRDTINDFSFNRRTDTVYDLYSDGSKRNLKKREVRVREHAGYDRILFGKEIAPRDLIVRFDGLDLLFAIKDLKNFSASFDDFEDQIRLVNWTDICDRLEYLEFSSGLTIDIATLIRVNAVSQDSGSFDFATLGTFKSYGFNMEAKPKGCEPRDVILSTRPVSQEQQFTDTAK
ncbi:calcium-binding protein [Thalassospira sp. SM2505]